MKTSSPETAPPPPAFSDALRVWARIGLLSFGGPAGQIALMHRILVDEKKWIDEARFLKALNFCMLLPGPEAQQLATYIGWRLHGVRGGFTAGALFVLPGALVIFVLSALYALYADLSFVAGLFVGVKAAIIAVVIEALLRISRRALKTPALYALAGAAFIAIFFFGAPFPAIIAAAGAIGVLGVRFAPAWLPAHAQSPPQAAPAGNSRGAFAAAFAALVLWLAPLGLLAATLGPDHVFTQEAAFFSKMAVVTFGGAYAVLAYVAQEAVQSYAWLAPGEMVDGLGLAETTPGPLVLVLQFVGFMAGWRGETGLSPFAGGAIGALIATWITFAPCFVWIFLGAPFVERLGTARLANGALTAITAAVVGVILNLAVWFSAHVLFRRVGEAAFGPVKTLAPDPASLDLAALALAAAATVLILRFRMGILPVLALSAAAGAAVSLV